MDRTKSIEHYHRQFLGILRNPDMSKYESWRVGSMVKEAGHEAIRALVEEIHDQGYVLGQLHADGIFQPGEEADVAALEDQLGIEKMKDDAHRRADQVTAVHRYRQQIDRLKADLLDLFQDAEQRAERSRTQPTVAGIRGYLVMTAQEAEQRRRLMEQLPGPTAEQVGRLQADLENEHRADRNGTS